MKDLLKIVIDPNDGWEIPSDAEAAAFEAECAEHHALMAARNDAIVRAGPGQSSVHFDHKGQRWKTQWGRRLNPFTASDYFGWSVPELDPDPRKAH